MKKYTAIGMAFVLSMFASISAFAQTAVAAAPSTGVAWLDSALAFIASSSTWLASQHTGVAALLVGGAIDLLLRFSKTSQPRDIVRTCVAFVDKAKVFVQGLNGVVLQVLSGLQNLLNEVASFLDDVVGQRVADPVVAAPAAAAAAPAANAAAAPAAK